MKARPTPVPPSEPRRPEPIDELIGRRVDGYEVLELLGKGGMGRVYRARDVHLDRHVALKTLVVPPGLDREEFLARFQREARVLSQVRHPNVADIYSAGRIKAPGSHLHGLPYYAMELIEGGSLDKVLADGRRLGGSRCLGYLIEAAAGLQEAHRQGLVHRDVKPANLMLGGLRGGRPAGGTPDDEDHMKIVDFGLARRIDEGDSVTRTQSVLGTPRYMAPEQIMGSQVDHRSDIYALGASFYHLFSGAPPFPGQDPLGVGLHHLQTPLVPLRERNPLVPAPVEAIIGRMMEKRPEDRYQSYAELMEDLQRARRGLMPGFVPAPAPRRSPGPPPSAEDLERERRWLWGVAAALVVGALALMLIFGGGEADEAPPIPPAAVMEAAPSNVGADVGAAEAPGSAGAPAGGNEMRDLDSLMTGPTGPAFLDQVGVRPDAEGGAGEGDAAGSGARAMDRAAATLERAEEGRGGGSTGSRRNAASTDSTGSSSTGPSAAERGRDLTALTQSVANLRAASLAVSIYMVDAGRTPRRLDQVEGASTVRDGWGRALHYRALDRDRFQLSSAGADGRTGSDDDIVFEDGRLVRAPAELGGSPR